MRNLLPVRRRAKGTRQRVPRVLYSWEVTASNEMVDIEGIVSLEVDVSRALEARKLRMTFPVFAGREEGQNLLCADDLRSGRWSGAHIVEQFQFFGA